MKAYLYHILIGNMLHSKILETSVDLMEPSDIYANDIVKLLMSKLHNRYVGYCFSSMLITKITEIIRHSDRIMVDNRLDGGCYINVQFKVEGHILIQGEILHGATVVQITNSNIIINHKYATGMMMADPKRRVFGLVQKDQTIPVIVQNMRYNIHKPQITIMCTPYTPSPLPQIYYNITEKLTVEDSAKINDILTMLKEEQDKHEQIKSNTSLTFFKNIMYPYKTQQKFTMSPLGNKFKALEITMKQLTELKNVCLILPDASDVIYCSTTKLDNENVQIIDSAAYPAISELLLHQLNYLTALRGFTEVYDTPDKVKEHLAYWKQCISLKE